MSVSGTLGCSAVPSFPKNAAAVVKSDATVFVPSIVWVGGAGDVVVTTAGGDIVTYTGVLAGAYVPVECTQVRAATTATNLVRHW